MFWKTAALTGWLGVVLSVVHIFVSDEGWQWFYDLSYNPLAVAVLVVAHGSWMWYLSGRRIDANEK